MACVVDLAQLPSIQVEMHNRAGMRGQVHSLESFQAPQRVALSCRRNEVKFGHFIAGTAPCVRHSHFRS